MNIITNKNQISYNLHTDKSFTFNVKNSDTNPATAVDITGATISLEIRASKTGDALFTKTVGSGITLSNALLGEYTLTLANTETLPTGMLYLSAMMTLSTNKYYILDAELTVNDTGF